MVFVVNCELNMGVGKIAAQVAHAGLAIQKRLLQGDEKMRRMTNEWEDMGYVVCLAAKVLLQSLFNLLPISGLLLSFEISQL